MPHQIVIVGAGFGGLAVAGYLHRNNARDAQITVIDPKSFFLFTPRLIDRLEQNASHHGECFSLSDLAKRRNFQFIQGCVKTIDRIHQKLTVEETTGGSYELPYDTLVLSSGSGPAYYGIPGAEASSLPLKSKADTEHILHTIAEHPSASRCVVIGAGPSGVEAIGALQHHFGHAHKWLLIQASPQILPGFPDGIVHGVMKEFSRRHINVSIGDPVAEIRDHEIKLASGTTIHADVIIWTAGIQPNAIPMTPAVARDRSGCIMVDRALRIDDHIFAAGDVVAYKERNLLIPKNAQTALLMGGHIGKNILRKMRGRSLKPFHYSSKGNVIVFGETGFIDLGFLTIQTGFAPLLRDLFYRYRFHQIVGS